MLKRLIVCLPMVMLAVGGSNDYAMPNFSRKPNVVSCHGPRIITNAFSFMEFTAYPLTGVWMKRVFEFDGDANAFLTFTAQTGRWIGANQPSSRSAA